MTMNLKHLDTKNNTIVVGGKYVLQERLGGGSFGQLYSALDKSTQNKLAVKLEQHVPNKNTTLLREVRVLTDLKERLGFPMMDGYGKEEGYNYLAMSLLGLNLEKLLKLSGREFSLKTVLMLADQMLTRVEAMHEKGFLHRDIKPENFCIGAGEENHNLFIIDFGLARSYKESDGQHIAYKEKKGLVGTARYASINTHLGIEQSRRDDLESIAYTLIYFLKGELPWQNIKSHDKQEKYKMIADLKLATSTTALCQGLPDEFVMYLNYVRGLGFTDTPNYKYLKRLFRTLFIKNSYTMDYNYDWMGIISDYDQQTKKPPIKIESIEIKQLPKVLKIDEIKKRVEFSPVEVEPAQDLKNSAFKSTKILNSKLPTSGTMTHRAGLNQNNKEEWTPYIRGVTQEKIIRKTKTGAEKNETRYTKKKSNKNRLDKVESTHSGSSKAPDASESQQGMTIASEFSINDFPSTKLKHMRPLNFQKKDFGHESRRLFFSSCMFDESALKSKAALTQRNQLTFLPTQSQEECLGGLASKTQECSPGIKENPKKIVEIEEDWVDATHCEWDRGNCLSDMMKNKKFVVNTKKG